MFNPIKGLALVFGVHVISDLLRAAKEPSSTELAIFRQELREREIVTDTLEACNSYSSFVFWALKCSLFLDVLVLIFLMGRYCQATTSETKAITKERGSTLEGRSDKPVPKFRLKPLVPSKLASPSLAVVKDSPEGNDLSTLDFSEESLPLPKLPPALTLLPVDPAKVCTPSRLGKGSKGKKK
jgi:hypothetical protein